MGLIAYIFGYVLKLFFDLIGNYGLAVILFSLLVKGIMVPFTIKQQKQLRKSQELQPKLQALQEKYKDDQQKLSIEYQKFMKENNYSPFGGCLTMILQFVFLIGIFYVVSRPITYMEKLDLDTINANLVTALSDEQFSGDKDKFATFVDEYVAEHSGDDIFVKSTKDISKSDDNYNEKAYLAFYKNSNRYYEIKILNAMYKNGELDLFGINLSEITMQDVKNIRLWILPVLTVIFYYLSLWMVSRKQKNTTKMKDADGNEVQMPNMMAMNFTMPLLSGWISISVPQGMALYWFINSFLQVIIQFVSEKIIKKENKDNKSNVVIEAKDVKVEENSSNSDDAIVSDNENSSDDPIESKKQKNSSGKNKNSSKKKKKK